jgi:mannose-6-phosphate isomerase-like protein (cupin superfamily)
MHIAAAQESPRNDRAGQVAYLLLAPGQFGSNRMAITMVHGEPGSEQPLHSHPEADQAYVVAAGTGLMRVNDEEQEVGPGTLVFIPPGAKHSIRNTGSVPLVYVSATSPPFDMPAKDSAFAYVPPEASPKE